MQVNQEQRERHARSETTHEVAEEKSAKHGGQHIRVITEDKSKDLPGRRPHDFTLVASSDKVRS
ncbi:MAG: hypothetical protein EBY75_07600 [Actinobacteria bacterium]|nr:hypothetical protein [Actinomycetota bacterium]NDA96224.1 hypothetical protein [Actinomycetota bacterium]